MDGLATPPPDPGIDSTTHHETQQISTPDSNGHELSPKQFVVLQGLVSGATVTKAADAGGVDRTTVHRWLREDCTFQAAHNAARRDLGREVDARLPHLAEAALGTVEEAVQNGDVRAALVVLKGLGALPGSAPAVGAENPGELAEDRIAADKEKKFLRKLKRII